MNHAFDELAKALAEDVSRREALRRVGTGLAGALLAAAGLSSAWGQGRGGGGGGGGGSKGCPSGQTKCKGTCVNLQTDSKNCGSCSRACGTGQACCGGTCINTASDRNNCGGCGIPCGNNELCNNGVCECTKTVCNGVCVDTATDPNNCGGCITGDVNGGVRCRSGTCVGGACVCQPGWITCGPGCCAPTISTPWGDFTFTACYPVDACYGGYNCNYGDAMNGANTCIS
jgi:Stigma-specific protein, Stig1